MKAELKTRFSKVFELVEQLEKTNNEVQLSEIYDQLLREVERLKAQSKSPV